MKALLADLSSTVWEPEQRRWLHEKFQTLADAFQGTLMLRGKRASVAVENFSGSTDIVVECKFVPRSVTVLDVVASDGFHYTSSYRWSWDNGFVRMTEYAGFLPTGGVLTFDVFIERA